MSLFLLLLFISPLILLISPLLPLSLPSKSSPLDATTYYVNEESVVTPQTGSLTNPFTSIAQAYSTLGAITCDLALLGSSASISAKIAFTSGSNYTIRPDSSFTSSTHFPINLNTGAVITVTSAVLTLQKLQLIEQNPSRAASSILFTTSSSSNLTFQSVLVRDVRTTANYYIFCKATSGYVNIIDSEFRNLTDFEFALVGSPIVVHGSIFTDLTHANVPFMVLTTYTGPYDGFAFKNNSFENLTIGKSTLTGFIYSVSSHMNVTFEDFYINNVTFTVETPFLYFLASSASNFDTQNDQTTLTIKNGVIKNMFETPKSTLESSSSTGKSLFVYANAQTILKVHSLSVTNAIFTNLSMITFTSGTTQFLNSWKVLPYFELTNISMKYTQNANFLMGPADTVNISNVYLEGLSIKDVTTTYTLFRIVTGHLMNVYNITAKNVTGPVFQMNDVLAHNFSTLSFNEMYTSQELEDELQSVIFFSKTRTFDETGLDPSRSQRDTSFDNVNLNGYTRIEGIDETQIANSSSFISGYTNYGKVYLTNSVWHNNFMNGFVSTIFPSLEVDNLTIEHDPEIPREKIPQHRVFRNHQNFVILYSNNVAGRSVNYEITETYIALENITVLNNNAVFWDSDSQYSSLFIFYCPLTPVNIFLQSSYFYNNIILNGLINVLENYQANIDFTNNVFDNNYATQTGTVFSSTNMRQATNTLNLTNNTFTNNRCDQNGGVFYFLVTNYNMHSVNNTYENNTASLAGGVGYAFRVSFVFLEEEGVYLNNSAGSLGGAWYISLNSYKVNIQNLEFFQTSFVNSVAQQKGGSIYLDNGGMTINQCTFNISQALVAGGNFYISVGGSISITDTNFTASSAPEGSFLYAEDMFGALTLSRIHMTEVSSDSFILTSTSGSLKIQDSTFENINSPLFLLSSVTTSIAGTTFNQISCSETSNSFCLFKVITSGSVEITGSSLTNFNSDVDIIALSDCTQATLSSVTAQNMLKLTETNTDQIFVLNSLNTKALSIAQLDFYQIGFSGVKATNSIINAQDCTFSNSLENTRLLTQSISGAKLSQPIQFMVLDSSSSTLTSISFIENSLNTLVDGGAIQILGSSGVHTLTDCIFENNQASNGGALSVKGQANSISIINSQFNENQASGNGGALNFSAKSVKNSLLISQSTFSQNSATFGGAIYLGTQALIVDSSSFTGNSAERGGALATMSSSSSTLVDLRESTFTDNSASEGAALIALEEMNFVYSTTSFTGNTATNGGDVASMPTSLRLKIYNFESYFLFVDDISAKDLLSDPFTVLIYDSTTADGSESIAFISGSEPNLLFEVTILDALGQTMSQTDNAQAQFKISSYSSSSSLIGILGTTAFTFTDSVAYIFNSFYVKGPFETTMTLSIEGTYYSQTSSSTQPLPSLKFPVILDKCTVGQLYDESTAICSYCTDNTYSIVDPLKAETCQKCFENAVCLGGSITYPAEGYWRIDESSDNLVKCPQTDSCLGGSKDGGKSISLTGFCEEGYEGIACSSCAPGYAKFGSSESCANCKESKLYYVMFGGYLLIQAIAIIFSIKMNLKKDEESTTKSTVIQSTLIKIVIDFVQILTLISQFNLNFPSVVSSLYDVVSKILPTNIDALSVDCFIALKKGNNNSIFFNKILVILAEPFAYMIFAEITWVIIFRVKKKSISKNPDFKSHIFLTMIIIIYLLQPGIIKLVLELFHCKNYASLGDPKYYLVPDVNVECWGHEHLAWALPIAIPTLIIGLLVPFTILAFWTRDKDLKADQRVQKAYTWIFKPYKNNALFWELATLSRKVILIIISVFITSQYLQAYLGFLLLVLYYCSLYKISPYNNPQLNIAEAVSLVSSAFILYSGLYFAQAEETTTVSYILFACDIISGSVFVIFVVYLFFRKPVASIQRKITKPGSKILTNLKIDIPSHDEQQALAPGLQSPISLQSHDPNDSPTSTERFMSTDRPFLPLIKIQPLQEGISTERKESHDAEFVLSPTNITEAGLFIFGSQPRESSDPVSFPVNFPEIELPPEDPVSQPFSEILENEIINTPRISPQKTKADWSYELSKRSSEKSK